MSGTYPSPTFNTLALQNPLAPTQGGTGANSAPAALTALGGAALAGSPSQTFSVGYPTAATHAVPLTGAPVNVMWFGAMGNASSSTPHDDTAAFQAALATGRHVYMPGTGSGYLISDWLTLSAPGQILFGDNRLTSFFVINTTFNMAREGVIVFNNSTAPPSVRRVGMLFTQPDTSTYSALTTYPVAIYAQGMPRFEVSDCLISNATNVIDMRGNSGGAYINDLQMSFYGTGILIDGSEDIVRINKLHSWPFNMTANQTNLFLYDTASVGFSVSSGRCDGLMMSDCLFINAQQVFLFQGTLSGGLAGDTFGTWSNCCFDTNIGIIMQAGDIAMVGGYFSRSSTIANQPAIYQTGGTLRISSVMVIFAQASTFPVIDVAATGASTLCYLQMDNCTFEGGAGDATNLSVTDTSGSNNASVNLSNCVFTRTANVAFTRPVVQQISGRLSMSNCRITDKGTGSGTFIAVTVDDWHRIIGNASVGWSNSFPAATLAAYAYN